MTNDKSDSSIFIFPDLVTALVGQMNSNETASNSDLTVCQVTNLGFESGIVLPGLTKCGQNLIVYKSISQTVLKSPEQSDPYENKIVEVKQSLIPGAGQGLFAKKSLEKGVIVAYFAGVAVSDTACSDSEYSISWLHGYGLDIPEDLRFSYCSTLGHKACHSFAPNCEYSWAFHPRFGKIRAILSLRQLEAGEEILTDYKYSYSKAPQWYKDDLSQFLVENFNMSLEEITDYISKMERSKKRTSIIT